MSNHAHGQFGGGIPIHDGLATVVSRLPKKKRAYHRKVRTGCITCKIRRLRCDEEKPACKRCTSTGRICDGYVSANPVPGAQSSSSTSFDERRTFPDWQLPIDTGCAGGSLAATPANVGGDARLLLPKLDPAELRSYRYYIEIVGPSLSGFFDADFWLVEVPRVCHSDSSIWHAIVSLGAAYECQRDSKSLMSRFALQQFNAAIHCLMEPNSPRHADKGRALTVSTIFAGIAIIQGQYRQAAMHVEGGCKMLRELEGDEMKPVTKSNENLKKTWKELKSLPIAIAPIRNILMRVDLMHKALVHGGVAGSTPPSQVMENNIFRVWRSYEAPQPSKGTHSNLTPETLMAASRAGESLMNGLVFASQQQANGMAHLITGEGDASSEVHRISVSQRPHARAYKELKKALAVFEHELGKDHCGSTRASRTALRNGTIPLKLFLAVCRMIFLIDPEEPSAIQRVKSYPDLCQEIITDTEKLWSVDDNYIDIGGRNIPLTPKTAALDALFMVALGGPSLRMRRKAADLMRARHGRSEGLFHSYMAANLADLLTDREIVVYKQYLDEQRLKPSEKNQEVADTDERSLPESTEINDDTFIPPQHRVRNMTMSFPETKRARVKLQTWSESAAGDPGAFVMLEW